MSNRSPLSLLLILAFAACSRSNNPAPAPPPVPPIHPTDTTHPVASNDSLYWQAVSLPIAAGGGFSDIWFTDTLHGIAAGADGYIYTSSDGGSNWIKTTLVQPGNSQPGLETLFFLTPSQGYVIGGNSFAVTTNGGLNWTIKARPDHVGIWPNFQFLSPSTGYLATGSALYKTIDTGTNWTVVKKDSASALFFTNINTGSIFSYPGKISNTTDGGNTWQPMANLPASSPTRNFCFLQYSDAQHGWFMDLYRLSISGNGGATWQTVFQPNSSDPLLDLQLLSGQSAYITTSHHLYKTIDGGATWQQEYTLPSTPPSYNSISALFFTDDHHGWACCSNGVVLRYRH